MTPKVTEHTLSDILTERGARYGKFADMARLSRTLQAAIVAHMGDRWLALAPDQQEALQMIAHKLARICNGDPDYGDSWRDVAGFSSLVADRLELNLER